MRGHDTKDQEMQLAAHIGIIAAAAAVSRMCYKGQNPVFLISADKSDQP
jgi:hypothetical protein